MRFDVWCSRIPYIEHIAPVWHAMPEDMRGIFSVHPTLEEVAATHGIQTEPYDAGRTEPLIIASRAEIELTRGRRYVFIEHGVGASYDNISHLPRLDTIELVLTVRAQEDVHRAIFGDRVVVIGCPKMDNVVRGKRTHEGKPIVAFSHHWDQRLYPETSSAWPWSRDAIEQIIEDGNYEVLGHKHPGDTRAIEKWFTSLGVEFVPTFAEVLERADCYVADNTSTLYEFAAIDRPVVVLSPPWYRRNVHHGGVRFWSHVPGVHCSLLEQLDACIAEALIDIPERQRLRQAAVEAAYGPTDNNATARAVEALQNKPLTPPTLPNTPVEYVSKRPQFRLGVDVGWLDGRYWRRGDVITLEEAFAMRDAGIIKGAGLPPKWAAKSITATLPNPTGVR